MFVVAFRITIREKDHFEIPGGAGAAPGARHRVRARGTGRAAAGAVKIHSFTPAARGGTAAPGGTGRHRAAPRGHRAAPGAPPPGGTGARAAPGGSGAGGHRRASTGWHT